MGGGGARCRYTVDRAVRQTRHTRTHGTNASEAVTRLHACGVPQKVRTSRGAMAAAAPKARRSSSVT